MSSQELDKLLAGLREETRGLEAPPHVEAALRSAFRAQSRKAPRSIWTRWAVAAAAVVAIMSGASVWLTADRPTPPPPAVKLAVAPPAPAFALEAVVTRQRPVNRAARLRVESAKVEPQKPVAPPPQEVATDFMPLENTETLAPLESGQILRVRVPQSTMMRFGFPVNPERMMEPVKADVVFGQDGIARAVRFVR